MSIVFESELIIVTSTIRGVIGYDWGPEIPNGSLWFPNVIIDVEVVDEPREKLIALDIVGWGYEIDKIDYLSIPSPVIEVRNPYVPASND